MWSYENVFKVKKTIWSQLYSLLPKNTQDVRESSEINWRHMEEAPQLTNVNKYWVLHVCRVKIEDNEETEDKRENTRVLYNTIWLTLIRWSFGEYCFTS